MKSYPDSISCLDLSRIKNLSAGDRWTFNPSWKVMWSQENVSREHYTYYVYLNIQESNN